MRKNIRFLGDEKSDQVFTDAMVVTQPTCLSGFALKILGLWTNKTCNETPPPSTGVLEMNETFGRNTCCLIETEIIGWFLRRTGFLKPMGSNADRFLAEPVTGILEQGLSEKRGRGV